jgi:hypothetical protein
MFIKRLKEKKQEIRNRVARGGTLVDKNEGSFWAKISKYWPLLVFMTVALFFASRFSVDTLKEFLQQHEKLGLLISL